MYNIAIDGPSAAGKSTIAKILAKELKILYLDTGAMYRAIGFKCLKCGIKTDDATGVVEMLKSTEIKIEYNNFSQVIILDGMDITKEIHRHEVGNAASAVSAIPEVRQKLVELQRGIAKKQSTVLDGRDIGTVVLPNAKYKFFLTSKPETRAMRRYLELKEKGGDTDYATVLEDLNKRDYNDSNRKVAPLKKAEDAIEIDATSLTIEETASLILSYIKKE